MTPKDFYSDLWTKANSEFNAFLSDKGMKGARVTKSVFDIEKRPRTLAIYPTASSGSTYMEAGGQAEVNTTFQMYCSGTATEEGVGEALEYFSALIEWLGTSEFGKYSEITDSVLCRMDEGEPINGFVLLLNSRLADETDAGWF